LKLRLARVLIAIAMAIVASGMSTALAWVADECCDDGCPGALDGNCPPNCSSPCAKIRAALDAQATPTLSLPREESSFACGDPAAPDLPLIVTGVFHPPRS
jgi:hypothetical protein